MSNLITRAISGAVFVFLVIGSIIYSHYAATIVFSGFALLGIIEFYKLFKNHESISIDWRIGTAFFIAVYGILILSIYEFPPSTLYTALVFPLLFIMVLIELWRKKKNPILNASTLFFGAFYVGLPFYMITSFNFFETKPIYYGWPMNIGTDESMLEVSKFPSIAVMFILVWTNDTFAYLTGRLVGKTKLFERISPNKTWEGTIGGVLFTILVGLLFARYVDTYYDATFWIVSAIVIAPCAILGDLFQSMMKRSLNIKDSGNIMPGHGGILDRFDAMLFSAPFFIGWISIYTYFWQNL